MNHEPVSDELAETSVVTCNDTQTRDVARYQNSLRAFTSYVSNPDYGWDLVCEKHFGTHPAQVFFDWNTARHVQEGDSQPQRRPYSREELVSRVVNS